MNREELESVIRQQITRVLANHPGGPGGTNTTTVANRATAAILRAADLYRCEPPPEDPQAPAHRADLYAEVWGGNI